jgi:hypothetical protein
MGVLPTANADGSRDGNPPPTVERRQAFFQPHYRNNNPFSKVFMFQNPEVPPKHYRHLSAHVVVLILHNVFILLF